MYREVQKICIRKIYTSENAYTVKPVYNGHPWEMAR